jgi:hypothetical protein
VSSGGGRSDYLTRLVWWGPFLIELSWITGRQIKARDEKAARHPPPLCSPSWDFSAFWLQWCLSRHFSFLIPRPSSLPPSIPQAMGCSRRWSLGPVGSYVSWVWLPLAIPSHVDAWLEESAPPIGCPCRDVDGASQSDYPA